MTSITKTFSRMQWTITIGANPAASWYAYAIDNGQLCIIEWLDRQGIPMLRTGYMDDSQFMRRAVKQGHLDMIQWLYKHGLRITGRDDTMRTLQPIHYAALKGYLNIVKWLDEQDVSLTLDYTVKGVQPIHLAAKNGHLSIVKYVHKRGVSLTVQDKAGRQPIHVAASNGHLAVLKYLYSEGVSLYAETKIGEKPIHFVSFELEVLKWLYVNGVPLTLEDNHGEQLVHRRCNYNVLNWLSTKKVSFLAINKNGERPIDIAVQNYDVDNIMLLQTMGVKLTEKQSNLFDISYKFKDTMK